MPLVFMDYQGGSRYRMGYIYSVEEKVAKALCDEPGPADCTGGRPFGRELNSKGAKFVEAFLAKMELELPIKAPEELGLVPYAIEPPDFVDVDAELATARRRAAEAEARVEELEAENEALVARVEELEAKGAEPEPAVDEPEPEPAADEPVDLSSLKVDKLKDLLVERGLSTDGKKDELIKRLEEHEG